MRISVVLALGCFVSSISVAALAAIGLPGVPTDANHPGSKHYDFQVQETKLTCSGREVDVFLPSPMKSFETLPVIVYGHGQAIGIDSYRATLEHLAKKGIAVIFPTYDTGFFDQDWNRMASDYVAQSFCAIHQLHLSETQVIFAGHSKGAYIAGMAAGVPSAQLKPRVIILFEPAGYDQAYMARFPPASSLTVVHSDQDSITEVQIAEDIWKGASSLRKQLIYFKSYTDTSPTLDADHFWPLTAASSFGGGEEGPFHYYGAWKWLVAAAWDLNAGGKFENPYLYGALAIDKGISTAHDDVKRSASPR